MLLLVLVGEFALVDGFFGVDVEIRVLLFVGDEVVSLIDLPSRSGDEASDFRLADMIDSMRS